MVKKASLQAIGLCGVDDSVHPHQVVMFARRYPLVEFGVLFRPEWEGHPRYPSKEWIDCLSKTICAKNEYHNDGSKIKLAAHLCGHRVDQVLQKGDDTFVRQLSDWSFGRMQINARAINISKDPSGAVDNFLKVVGDHPELEFILQKNAETQPLWEGVLEKYKTNNNDGVKKLATVATATPITGFPSNVSMLLDESKGTGVLPETWPPIPPNTPYKIGYAGGIGPSNVSAVLSKIENSLADSQHHPHQQTVFWIDMESSLRSQKNGRDIFDLDKCYRVISEVCDGGFASHPPFLERDEETMEPTG